MNNKITGRPVTNENYDLKFSRKKTDYMEFLMTIIAITVLSTLLIVLGLNYILIQLMSAWCDPNGH